MKLKLLIFTLFFIFASLIVVKEVIPLNNSDAFPMALGSHMGSDGDDEDEDDEDFEDNIKDLEKKVKEYQEKIRALQEQEKSLQGEIVYADSQIGLTENQIELSANEIIRTQEQIEALEGEIGDLQHRITVLKNSIDYQQQILNERIRSRYKSQENSLMFVLLGGTEVSSVLQKAKYLSTLEEQDQKLLGEMRKTREAYDSQKRLYEDKKEDAEDLEERLAKEKQNLEAYKNDLDRQKASKEELLSQTQSDEQKYQNLLAQVESELAAMRMAHGVLVGGEDVEEGDIIGFMGNTGCSSGPHLHFGYIRNGKTVDPLPYLQDDKLEWPVDNWQITQHFGANYDFYMRNFGVPGHDALDIISKSQWSGAPIRAAKDGKLHYAQDARVYCPWLNNSIGKGAIIDHGDGEKTIYWHMQ